jgi:hypothetical protein
MIKEVLECGLVLGVTPWLTHRERRSVALVRSDDRAFDSGGGASLR